MIAGLFLVSCKDEKPKVGGSGPAVPLHREGDGPQVPGPGVPGPYAPGSSGGAPSGGASSVPAPQTNSNPNPQAAGQPGQPAQPQSPGQPAPPPPTAPAAAGN